MLGKIAKRLEILKLRGWGWGPRCLPFLLEASISQVHAPLTGRALETNEQIKVCSRAGKVPSQVLKKQKEPKGHTKRVSPKRIRGREEGARQWGRRANLTTSSNLKYFQRRPFLRSDHKSSSLEELLTPKHTSIIYHAFSQRTDTNKVPQSTPS